MKAVGKVSKKAWQACDCLVSVFNSDQTLEKQKPDLNAALGGKLNQIQTQGLFTGTHKQHLLLPSPEGINCKYLLLLGSGTTADLSMESLRECWLIAARQLKSLRPDKIVIETKSVFTHLDIQESVRHIIEVIGDSFYTYEKLPRSKSRKAKSKSPQLTFLGENASEVKKINQGGSIGLAIDKGKCLARDLGNMPGNLCTPNYLAKEARKLSKSHAIKTRILNEKEMQALGMDSLLSVSRGSREPAKLIVMQYFGAKDKQQKPHALVGKGLTFDAGGISIKPSAKMDEMKYDMCGGASVFGTMLAAAEMSLPINIVGIVPSSENLPDGKANKPGDVVKSMSGTTIEILNTDAEGRLILCDALTYCKRFKPQTVIDIATLTGAVLVALGHQTAGLMGNDQALIDDILQAGETSQDHAWQLPLKETYKKQLKSEFADLANIGGSTAGTITAGCFLSHFAQDFKWAHLDIAGTAWGGSVGKRASGRAVPILTQYLIDRSKS